jgi:hypothetical protein
MSLLFASGIASSGLGGAAGPDRLPYGCLLPFCLLFSPPAALRLATRWLLTRGPSVTASNPPYIADDDPRVEPAVRRWEPAGALFAGPTGPEALEIIVAAAPRHLRSDGWLLLEHGDTQGEPVRRQLVAAGYEEVRTHRDLAGRERYSEGRIAAH